MADRTVKVKLKADVGDYISDVAKATAATRLLREEAERFEDKYTATLDVKTRGAGGLQQTEQSMRRMSKASGDLQTRLAGLKKELGGLDGKKLYLQARSDVVAEIAKVKRHLASLNNQKITIPIAAEITQGNIELANLEQRLERLDRTKYEPEVELKRKKLLGEIAEVEAALRKLADEKLQINPGEAVLRLRRQVLAAAKTLPDIPLHADSSEVDREIAGIRAELMGLSKVRAQNAEAAFRRAIELQTRLQTLSRTSTTSTLRLDTGSAARQLAQIEQASDRAGRAMGRLDRSTQKSRRGMLFLARQAADTSAALRQLSMVPLLVGMTPAITSVIGSVKELLGVLGFIPATVMGAGASIGVVVAGLRGFKDAVSDGGEALGDLAPNARKAAEELRSQADEWHKVRLAIQDALFSGAVERMDKLGKEYLPVIRDGAKGLATEIGDAANAFADFALQADSVKDTKDGLELNRQAAERLAPIVTNLSTIFRDMAAVGARELPALATGIENMTRRWRDAIATARANGDLAQWMRAGWAEAQQLGRILKNTGGILAGVGAASRAAGIDTVGALDRMTSKAHEWVDSWQGQAQIRSSLAGLKADAEAFVPGLKDLAMIALEFVQNLSNGGVLQQAGDSFSALMESARPVAEVLGQLTSAVLRPLLATIELIAPALGPAIAAFVAFRTAAKGMAVVRGSLDNLGQRFNNAASAASGGANQISRVTRTLDGLGKALPLIGVLLVGAAAGYEYLRDRAAEAADGVLSGSMTLKQAYEMEAEALRRQANFWTISGESGREYAEAQRIVNQRIHENLSAMGPLERANATVTLAQQRHTQAVIDFGINSPQARSAAEGLRAANHELEVQQIAASLGTDRHTASLIRNRDEMLAATDADLAWHSAVQRATEAVAINGATLDRNTAAGVANWREIQNMTRAALDDIAAKRDHDATTEELIQTVKDHKDQLYDTMIQMGMSKEEARRYVDQLGLVPESQVTNFSTPGLADAITSVKELADLLKGLQGTTKFELDRANMPSMMGKIPGRATGGPIFGPGSSTSDSILARLSDGEWVMRAQAVRDQGHDKMAMLNAGMADIVPKGMLPGFAGGGRVDSRVIIDGTALADEAKKRKNEWFPPMPAGGWGGGVQRWAGIVLQALAIMGQPAGYLGITLRRMNQESGGNPAAFNGWDINARRGTPSVGLMQTIGPTYQAYKHPAYDFPPYMAGASINPLSNILASMRYALARYGSLPAAYNKAGGYDAGGVASGVGFMAKHTIKPERVLSPRQTVAFERLVDVMDRPTPIAPLLAAGTRGGDGASVVNNFHNENHFTEAVDLDLFNQRQDFAVRAVSL